MGKPKVKPNYRRRSLRLPDLDHCKRAVLNSLGSPASRRVYEYAIDQFIAWYCSEPRLAFNRIVVVRYRVYLESRGLAANTINQQLAAVRRLAHEAADAGLLSPELAAGITRVKGVKQLGFRAGNWLSPAQSSEVLRRAYGEGMRAKRDYAMLAMLFGCGFRRSELVGLELGEIQVRQGHWAVVDLIGKGGHIRTVPIPEWVKAALDQWTRAAGVREGRIFRAVARTGKIWGKGISQNSVWYVVRTCCERVGLEHIAPHDLRRTCAQLCHDSGGELEQIQFLLGHASVQTTERYYEQARARTAHIYFLLIITQMCCSTFALSRLQAEPRKSGKRSVQAQGGSAATGVEPGIRRGGRVYACRNKVLRRHRMHPRRIRT
jgi:integrase